MTRTGTLSFDLESRQVTLSATLRSAADCDALATTLAHVRGLLEGSPAAPVADLGDPPIPVVIASFPPNRETSQDAATRALATLRVAAVAWAQGPIAHPGQRAQGRGRGDPELCRRLPQVVRDTGTRGPDARCS